MDTADTADSEARMAWVIITERRPNKSFFSEHGDGFRAQRPMKWFLCIQSASVKNMRRERRGKNTPKEKQEDDSMGIANGTRLLLNLWTLELLGDGM